MSTEAQVNAAPAELYGRRELYQIAVPKGDSHRWSNCRVSFFGKMWRVIGGEKGASRAASRFSGTRSTLWRLSMSNVTIELNSAGVRELLQSAAIRAAVMEAAAGVCARAGDG